MAEAGGVATVTATLSAVSGQSVTVNLGFSGTATITNDYLASATSIVIPAGSTTGTITLTAVQDTLDEVDETIVVDISTVLNGTESRTQQVTAIITDDDPPPTVAFNAAASSGSESVTAASVPVSLSTASGKTVTVTYAVTGGTATGGGVDYTLAAGTLTFAPGVTSQNISIAVVNDTLDEDDETIQVALSSPTNSTLGATTTHTYTILDDDPPPSLSINNVTVTEGNSGTTNANFTVTLSAASGRTVTVNYATADGTATAPADYAAIPTTTLTFNPGQTTKTITVPVNGDIVDESDEAFTVNLFNPTNATLSSATGTGTIIDDDGPPTVTLSLSGSPMTEAGGVATVTATLGWPSAQTVTVNLAFSGTATLTNDYTASGTSIVIPPGSTTGSITLTAVQDSIDEVDETIVVDISTVTNGIESGTQQVTATIIDDDGPTISINNATVTEGNTGQTVNAIFSVSLSATSPQSITVDYSTADGTATAPADYVAKSGTLTFPANSTTPQTITIVVNGDNVDEIDETFTVNLSNPVHATIANGTGTGTIIDNDNPPTVAFSLASSSGAESVTPANLAVALSSVSGKTVTVDYAVSGGTATGGGVDRTLAGDALSFAPGVTHRNDALTVRNDAPHR